ncbi:MAG: DUF3515 domain-containing protein [Jatrophihabitans sp.]|uniref:DUF3515 domain-containing protein n=1 Tax=Jatrophihabitans sp. TaxID=1932789 RepID=UPI003F81EFFC
MTIPVVVLALLLFANLTADPKPTPTTSAPGALPAVTAPAPPLASAHQAECTEVLQKLPIQLSGLVQRVVHPTPDTPFVVAWGQPPVIWSCGVERPKELTPGSSAQAVAVDGVWFLPVASKDETIWTAVDRSVYFQVVVPKGYAQPPLAPIADAIATLPQVCVIDASKPLSQQCTRRK